MATATEQTRDVWIRNGLVVDGSGAPPIERDIALSGGKIVDLDSIDREHAIEIDAARCWVTPGLIDPHTHLDAQLCWDPSGSPSNLHGVTTVILGLCGFGVAPCPPGGGEYLLRSLEVVEEIPYRSSREGVPFEWETWRDYRDYIDAQALGVNVAGFVPHSALRYFAMGDRARTEVASSADRDRMVEELTDALEAGAVGFATSRGPNHVDGFQQPVPSRLADTRELAALVAACRDRIWQINVETKFSHDATALITEIETYARWTSESSARLTWTPFYADPGESVWKEVLSHNARLNRNGTRIAPQVTAVPITLLLRFNERSFLTAIPGWEGVLEGFFTRTVEERKAILADPQTRAVMKAADGDPKNPLTPDFENWSFTFSPAHPELGGTTLTHAARAAKQDPVDFLCDVVIEDELETLIELPVLNRHHAGAMQLVCDDHTLLGLGDAGAHVMSVTNYRYPTFFLGDVVERKGEVPIEVAINRMTKVPADMHGLHDRGELRVGLAADLCVIDRERLDLGAIAVENDLPDGGPRLVQSGHGFKAVFVNGVQTIADDGPTGARSGSVLRARASPT